MESFAIYNLTFLLILKLPGGRKVTIVSSCFGRGHVAKWMFGQSQPWEERTLDTFLYFLPETIYTCQKTLFQANGKKVVKNNLVRCPKRILSILDLKFSVSH